MTRHRIPLGDGRFDSSEDLMRRIDELKGGKGVLGDAKQARAALIGGDFRLARYLAQRAFADAAASGEDKHEASEILKATAIDKNQLVVGLALLVVLLVLFTWVLLHRHVS